MKNTVTLLWVVFLLGGLVLHPVTAETTSQKETFWVKSFGSIGKISLNSLVTSPNGTIIAVGSFDNSNNKDFLVMSILPSGRIAWAKTYGGSQDDIATSVSLDSEGNIIVAGVTYSFGIGTPRYSNVMVLKLDRFGNIKWSKVYGGSLDDGFSSYLTKVAVVPNGDIILASTTESFGKGNLDFWILRLDKNGNIKWQRTYGSKKNEYLYAILTMPDGDIVLSGLTFSSKFATAWVLRINGRGDIKWSMLYGERMDARALALAPRGDIIVAGYSVDSKNITRGDMFVSRLNGNGSIEWLKVYSCSDDCYANSVVSLQNDIIVYGTGFLKLNAKGYIKWAREFGGRDMVISQNGIAVLGGGYPTLIARFNIDEVSDYSGWGGWKGLNVNIDTLNYTEQSFNVQGIPSDSQVQDVNVKVDSLHDIKVKTLWMYNSTVGILKVVSSPSESNLYINNVYKGKTPVSLKLKPGHYSIVISKEGYKNYSTKMNISAGKSYFISVSLALKETSKKGNSSGSSHTSVTNTPNRQMTTTSSISSTETNSKQTSSKFQMGSSTSYGKNGGRKTCGPASIVILVLLPLLLKRHR